MSKEFDQRPFCPYCKKVVNARFLSDLSSPVHDLFLECENGHIVQFTFKATFKKE